MSFEKYEVVYISVKTGGARVALEGNMQTGNDLLEEQFPMIAMICWIELGR